MRVSADAWGHTDRHGPFDVSVCVVASASYDMCLFSSMFRFYPVLQLLLSHNRFLSLPPDSQDKNLDVRYFKLSVRVKV